MNKQKSRRSLLAQYFRLHSKRLNSTDIKIESELKAVKKKLKDIGLNNSDQELLLIAKESLQQ